MTLEDAFEAYYDCRKPKRNKTTAIAYEMNYEERLIEFRDAVNNRTYHPGTSICFVITYPKYGEVFAANFSDRVAHHYIRLRLEPLIEDRVFNDRVFNCRTGKGQLVGINQLSDDIKNCSENYTQSCYIAKLDIQRCFMSVEKVMLARMVDIFIQLYYKGDDIEDLRYVCREVILHSPEKDCERRSPMYFWNYIPKNKSLFTIDDGYGVSIGNLFAQLFINMLLSILDWTIEREGIKYHGRYVDDFYLIHKDKQFLLNVIPKLREVLASIGLVLHPKKFYLQHYTKGVSFIGSIVKPHCRYVEGRTLNRFAATVMRLNKALTTTNSLKAVYHGVASINSYLGLLRHYNEYGMRRKILNQLDDKIYEYCYIKGHHEILALKKKYKPLNIIIEQLKRAA